jgi:hypothetical protein
VLHPITVRVLRKMDFENYKLQVMQLILSECPGRSSVVIDKLIDRHIVDLCSGFFNGTAIESTAKNILFAEVISLTTTTSG